MPLPAVSVQRSAAPSLSPSSKEDSISALLLSADPLPDGLNPNTTLGPFYSISEIEALGINTDYDAINQLDAFYQCQSFFEEAPGQELYLMLIAPSISLQQALNPNNAYAAKLLADTAGKVRLLGVGRTPPSGYIPDLTNGMDQDVYEAISQAKTLTENALGRYEPLQVLLPGRAYQDDPSVLIDLKGNDSPEAEHVSVILGQESSAKEVMIGRALGKLAASSVQQNIGRVKNGALIAQEAYLSNNTPIESALPDDLERLNNKGYIFPRLIPGKEGYYFSDDHTASSDPNTFHIATNRVIDKALRLARAIYVEEILDNIRINAKTGRMLPVVSKGYQEKVSRALADEMLVNGELAYFEVRVDPYQDIVSSNEISMDIQLYPVGTIRKIAITLGQEHPYAQNQWTND